MVTQDAVATMLSSTLGSRASHALVERLVHTIQSAPSTPEGIADGCKRVLVAVRMFVGEAEARSLAIRLTGLGVSSDVLH